jgi:hypothetical protein
VFQDLRRGRFRRARMIRSDPDGKIPAPARKVSQAGAAVGEVSYGFLRKTARDRRHLSCAI